MSKKERIKSEIDICKALILAFLTAIYLGHLVSLLLIMKKLIYGKV